MARFKFTQPKTKNGYSDFFLFLLMVQTNPNTFTSKHVRNRMFKHLTFSALRESGLLTLNGSYKLTQKGLNYVTLVKRENYSKDDLIKILKSK